MTSNPTGIGGFRDHPDHRARFTHDRAVHAGQIAGAKATAAKKARILATARLALHGSERDLGVVLEAIYQAAYGSGYQAGLRGRRKAGEAA